MKRTIKSIFFVSLIFISIPSFAQTLEIKGGLSLTNILHKDDDDDWNEYYGYEPRIGYNGGVTIEYPISKFLSLETGFLFTTRGYHFEESDVSPSLIPYNAKYTYNLYYLDVPAMIKASHEIFKGVKIYAATGPYLGFALDGKKMEDYTYNNEEDSEEYSIYFGSDEDTDDFRSIDWGVKFDAGFEIKNFLIGCTYDLGLMNCSPNLDNDLRIRQRGLQFAIGYRITFSSKDPDEYDSIY